MEFTDAIQDRLTAARPGAAGPRSAPPGEDPCSPPLGATPAPGRRWLATPLPGNRGAPARGVDVKPPRNRGPGEAPGGQNPPKSPKKGFLAQNPDFGPFSAKTAFFRPFCLSRTSPRGGFYINPSRRGPAVPKRGFLGPSPGNPRKRGFSGIFPDFGENRGFRDPGGGLAQGTPGTPPGNRGAPARGVDVKPPRGAVRRDPPGPWGPPDRVWDPPGAPEPSGGPSGPPPGGPGARSRGPGAGVLHQPLAPGPRGSPGRPGRALRDPLGPEPLRRGWGAPAPYRGGGADRRGSARGGRRLRIR